jgi:AcrR family transcriptional regulator
MRRFHTILDAGGAVFVERGVDGATMEDIAGRAGTSIGSLYQFFPNKAALVDGLVERYLDRARALLGVVPEPDAVDEPLGDLIDRVVAVVAAFHASEPWLRAVWLAQPESGRGERHGRGEAKH